MWGSWGGRAENVTNLASVVKKYTVLQLAPAIMLLDNGLWYAPCCLPPCCLTLSMGMSGPVGHGGPRIFLTRGCDYM